jgi:alpha-methylacyl-CoA racemase
MSEATEHPHVRARGTVVELDGIQQPAPAPRFSKTPGSIRRRAAQPGQHTDEALADWGFGSDELAKLRDAGAIK